MRNNRTGCGETLSRPASLDQGQLPTLRLADTITQYNANSSTIEIIQFALLGDTRGPTQGNINLGQV